MGSGTTLSLRGGQTGDAVIQAQALRPPPWEWVGWVVPRFGCLQPSRKADVNALQRQELLNHHGAAAHRSQHQRSPGPVDTNSLPARAKSGATARLLSGLTISAVPVHRGSQAKVFPQGPAFVLCAKQTSTLQFGNHHLDEILAATG